ncbi:hypothetical protein COB57_04050 [Candidatus Peregrinibacteria bacterium]|nr:MAG: hypothetical protein COB57_04050 [Candidatus Peregrinibacteria bacterium]
MKTKPQVFNMINDLKLNEQLIENIKNRSIDQLFIYQQEGAKNYIDNKKDNMNMSNIDDYLSMFKKIGMKKNEKIAILSLGCGDAEQEKYILSKLDPELNIHYYGVDSSLKMLDYAKKNMKDVSFHQDYICADFSSQQFRRHIQSSLSGFDKRIFIFWRTLPNIKLTNIVDTFYNIMEEKDILWMDAKMRSGSTQLSFFQDSELYQKHHLQNPQFIKFCFSSLRAAGFSSTDGEFKIKSAIDPAQKSLECTFIFKLNKTKTLTFNTEILHIDKNEEITVLKIMNFDKKGVIEFFEKRDFHYIGYCEHNRIGQFMFEKKAS